MLDHFHLAATYFVAVLSISGMVLYLAFPWCLSRWLKKKDIRQSEITFWKRIAMAFAIAFHVVIILDSIIGLSGGPAYSSALIPFEIAPTPTPALVAIRDGMTGNLMFFLCAGFIAARASLSQPESESIKSRIQMVFPKLSGFELLQDSFVELALERSTLSEAINLDVIIEEFNPQIGAYKTRIERKETIINLFETERYQTKRFGMSVLTDPVTPPDGILGEVFAASFAGTNSDDHLFKKCRFIEDGKPRKLTLSDPHWAPEPGLLEIPGAGKGFWRLKYWYWAKCGTPYVSKSRRPTARRTVRIFNRSNSTVSLRMRIDGQVDLDAFDLEPQQEHCPAWKPIATLPKFELVLSPPAGQPAPPPSTPAAPAAPAVSPVPGPPAASDT